MAPVIQAHRSMGRQTNGNRRGASLSSFRRAIVVAFLLMAFTSAPLLANNRQGTDPQLGLIAPEPNIPGSVEIHGTGFTPGGDVWVAILDIGPDNTQVAKTLQSSTAAADGSIDIVIMPRSLTDPCEDSDTVRAFDSTTNEWTDPVILGCALVAPLGHPVPFAPE